MQSENNASQVEQSDIKKDETTALDPVALKAELDKYKATNERLLQESKDYKAKFSTLKTNLEQETKTKLEKEQDWKSLLEQEKIANQTLNENLAKMKKQTLIKALNFEVSKFAKDAYDVEDVISSLDHNTVKIDEENLSILGVEEAVNALRTKKSYLFNSGKKPSMVDDRPGFNKPEKKDPSKLTINESIATLRDLMSENARGQ